MSKERHYKEPKPLPSGYRPVVATHMNLSDMGQLRNELHKWIHMSEHRRNSIATNARREMKIYIEVTEDFSDELGPFR
jgi:hypothetical protein